MPIVTAGFCVTGGLEDPRSAVPGQQSRCGFRRRRNATTVGLCGHRAFGPGDPDAAAGLFDTPSAVARN